MKGLLLKKEDYDRIMKMDISEIIKFLQEDVYKEEINAYALKYTGIKLAEISLTRHLSKLFIKLRKIADQNTQRLMDLYLKRYDFWNLKTLLRGKSTNAKEEELLDLMILAGSLKQDVIKRLFAKNTIKEVLSGSGLVSVEDYKGAIDKYESEKDLSEIENLIDYHYYTDTLKSAVSIPKNGRFFKEFFEYEIDIYNLRLILKKISFKLNKKDVEKYILSCGKKLSRKTLFSMLDAESMEVFIREVSKTSYGEIFQVNKEETGNSLLRFEVLMEEFLLKKRILLFHQHPMSVDAVLGFMFAKEIEVKNLLTIIKSKKLEFTEDYVKKLIIIG
jgi:V/A-type H+-transporting ATPase subunit C